MTDPNADTPVDPMDDSSLADDPPQEPEAVQAAKQMNDPDGTQPGATDETPEPDDGAPLPELVGE